MKLILDTEDFSDLEFNTLLSTIKEFNDLKDMIKSVENDDNFELEIKVTMDKLKCYGYWYSHKLPKQLLLELLHEIEKVYERDIKNLLERTGLSEVE